MSIPQSIPAPNAPLADKSGSVTLPWLRFFQALWARTGGSSGTSTPPGGTPQVLIPTGSPFSYTASTSGVMAIGGNGVQIGNLIRDAVATPLASHYGMVPMETGDEILIDYIGNPNFTWLPN